MNSASLNQIASNIRNLLRGGRSSNDDLLSLEQIKFQIKYYRSLLIRRDQERNMNRSSSFEQDLGHVAVSTIDSAEDDSISSGRTIVRTDDKIPAPIRLKNKEAITYIVSDDKVGTPIPLIDAHRTPWQEHNKYTQDKCFAFYRGGYLYIYNNVTLDTVYIRGIFEDPEEVYNFTRENGLDLYDDNSPFPISNDMLQNITQSILSGEGKIVLGTPNDKDLNRD